MPDLNSFLADIKRAALEAVMAAKPFSLTFGTVVSTAPLKVTVDQKLTLFAEQLILTNAVRDYSVMMTVDHATESALGTVDLTHNHKYTDTTEETSTIRTTQDGGKKALGHSHAYKGTKKYTVHLGLKVGERVILLRADGGQQYVILDRVEAPKI